MWRSTGDSAEDKMSNAAGCLIVGAAVVILCIIGAVVLLIRRLA